MIAKEKIEALAKYMGENEERAEMLMALSAEEACEKINADGFDFTTEELAEFAQGIVEATKMGKSELGAEDLDSVAGGVGVGTIALALICNQAQHAWNKGQEWGRAIRKWLF